MKKYFFYLLMTCCLSYPLQSSASFGDNVSHYWHAFTNDVGHYWHAFTHKVSSLSQRAYNWWKGSKEPVSQDGAEVASQDNQGKMKTQPLTVRLINIEEL